MKPIGEGIGSGRSDFTQGGSQAGETPRVEETPPTCRFCGVVLPCRVHGRVPESQADWDELHRETADALTIQEQAAEITALRQQVQTRDEQIAQAMAVLGVNMPENGLVDACKQVKQAAMSEADNSEKLEANAQALREALEKAIETIRVWHGMGMPAALEVAAWKLYQDSPEMKAIRAALASPSSTRQET